MASKDNRDIEVMFTDGGVPETERKILSVIREEDEVLASFSDQPPELNFEDVDQPKESGNSTFTDKKEIESDRPHSNHLTPNEQTSAYLGEGVITNENHVPKTSPRRRRQNSSQRSRNE